MIDGVKALSLTMKNISILTGLLSETEREKKNWID